MIKYSCRWCILNGTLWIITLIFCQESPLNVSYFWRIHNVLQRFSISSNNCLCQRAFNEVHLKKIQLLSIQVFCNLQQVKLVRIPFWKWRKSSTIRKSWDHGRFLFEHQTKLFKIESNQCMINLASLNEVSLHGNLSFFQYLQYIIIFIIILWTTPAIKFNQNTFSRWNQVDLVVNIQLQDHSVRLKKLTRTVLKTSLKMIGAKRTEILNECQWIQIDPKESKIFLEHRLGRIQEADRDGKKKNLRPRAGRTQDEWHCGARNTTINWHL